MNNKNKKNTTTKKHTKSLKGEWGHVGAPPKSIKLPNGAFTVKSAVGMNPSVCELTVRTRLKEKTVVGELFMLKARKQKGGKSGRPQEVFIKAENFNPETHELADQPVTATVIPVAETPETVAVSTEVPVVVIPSTQVEPEATANVPVTIEQTTEQAPATETAEPALVG